MIRHPAKGFVENVKEIVAKMISRDVPAYTNAVVTDIDVVGGLMFVKVRRLTSDTADAGYYSVLGAYVPRIGDTVLCARFGGTLVILGDIQRAGGTTFISNPVTGNSTPQSTPHSLGVVPGEVLIMLVGGPASYVQPSITEGVHDETNIIATVTTGWVYRIMAWA